MSDAHYDNTNIDTGTAAVTALSLVLNLVGTLSEQGILSNAAGNAMLNKAVNSVQQSQREEARALVKGIIPGAQI